MEQKKPAPRKRTYRAFEISVSLKTGCYRHLLVRKTMPLDELGWDIIEAFGFDNDHLSAFFMDKFWGHDAYYVTPLYAYDDEEEEEARSASDYKLEQVLKEDQSFYYLFDFGDEWRFHCRVLRSSKMEGKETQVIRSVGEAPEQYPDWDRIEHNDQDED